MSKTDFWDSKDFWGKMIFILAVVVFWTSAWDSIEILVDKFLENYWDKNDTNRLYVFMFLTVISLIVIRFHRGLYLVL